LAKELGLAHRVFSLASPVAMGEALDGVGVVAHCAGPFSATARPMIEVCLSTRTSYLDITGEIDVLEYAFGRDLAAREAGVVVLPGTGFDVVPTDCLASMLAAELADASVLELAFLSRGGMSRGTARTSVEGAALGGRARINGELVSVPLGWRSRAVPFPSGVRDVVSIPWGDLSTAYRSTGIPSITTYTHVPVGRRATRAGGALVGTLMRVAGLRALAGQLVTRRITGPDAASRSRTTYEVWGEARNDAGDTVSATLICPNGDDLTADSVVRAVVRLDAAAVPPGTHTPATAFGPAFVRQLDGVTVSAITRSSRG
jgi:saccharopine dehydrogenase (NAD+, L-lysine-forming)